MSESKPWPPPERVLARQFATVCADQGEEMAAYHMHEAQEFMWGMCAERYILPRVERIHAMLVQLGASEQNELDFNDLDDHTFFIPVESIKKKFRMNRNPDTPRDPEDFDYEHTTKVLVHCTQNRDYLFVLSEELGTKSLHIRRIWRKFDPEYFDHMETPSTLIEMMDHLEWLSEFTDYPRVNEHEKAWRSDRPGLELYRDLGFQIPNVDEPFKHVNLYGDARDKGYILSYLQHQGYNSQTSTRTSPLDYEFIKAEYVPLGTEILMSCHLPSLELACQEALEEKGLL